MRITSVLSVGLGILTATGAVSLAVFSATCTACGHVPTHHVEPPPTPGLVPSSATPTPQATTAAGTRLSRALLTRFGGARVTSPPRSGTYGTLAGVPLPNGPIGQSLSGRTPVSPRGCGTFPPARWTRTAASAQAATVTLTIGRRYVHLRETLLTPRRRPLGLTLPTRCRTFTLPNGTPARTTAFRPSAVGDVSRGTVTLTGRQGTPNRAILYTIVFRVGHVYGVTQTTATGPNPATPTVRKAALLYTRRAATQARRLS